MYTPPQEILAQYADLLVKFALNGGIGVRPGEVTQATVPDIAKPLYKELQRAILQGGGHPKLHLIATEMDGAFFEIADDAQLTFFPEAYKRAEADLINHQVSIIADVNPAELKNVDPEKLFMAMDARKKYRDWLFDKEHNGTFSWTLALYGTEGMAKEAGMTLQQYWDQIIHGCYLDMKDPISEWKRIQSEQARLKAGLDSLGIDYVHVEGENIDLKVSIGQNRKWLGGSCRNIPSYELFISPDWRGCEGTIYFNQPLYRYGNILRDITLTLEKGCVVHAEAKEGQKILDAMLKRHNANKLGEFSLTDRRFSRITRFMANTLFDENIGGDFGNTHVALGRAYQDSYTGDPSEPSETEWTDMGYNNSPEHTDIISTEDRLVTAYLMDGGKKVIFKSGVFTI